MNEVAISSCASFRRAASSLPIPRRRKNAVQVAIALSWVWRWRGGRPQVRHSRATIAALQSQIERFTHANVSVVLFLSVKHRRAIFAPFALYCCGLAVLAWLLADVQHPAWRALFPGALAIVILTAAISDTRLSRVVGDALVVRTLFRCDRLDLTGSEIFVNKLPSTRSTSSYELLARDTQLHARLAEAWSSRGAERARARLAACLLGTAAEPARTRAAAPAQVHAQQARDQATQALAQAQLEAFNRSAAPRRVVYFGLRPGWLCICSAQR